MKLKKFTSSVLVFQVLLAYTFGNVFVIFRNRSCLNRDWDSRDYFKIPTSMCYQSSRLERNRCGSFGATIDATQNCSCSCDPERATFVFHERQWTCLDNTIVRELERDCSNIHYFNSELDNLPTLDFELLALNFGDVTPTNIQYGSDIRHCEVYPNTSWYLGCNGIRLGSSQYLDKMKELFTFTVGNTSSAGQFFDLKIKSGVQNTQLLQGGIIFLGIQCNESSGRQYYGCLMFKLVGQLTCPAQVKMSSTVTPQEPTLTGTPTSTREIFPNSIVTRAISDMSQPTLISQHTRTRSIASSTQSTTVFPSIVSIRLSPDHGHDSNNSPYSLGLITGITVFILLIVVIVGLIFYRRCYSNKISDASNSCTEDREEQGSVMMTTRTNSSIQQDAEKMYKALNIKANEPQFYASSYCVPQSPATRDNPGIVNVYDTIDDPEGYSTEDSQESFYNDLQECTLNSETELKHPAAYNILEEEHSVEDGPKKPVNYGLEPMFNVLTEPYGDGESYGDCGSFSSETQVTAEGPEGPVSNASEPEYNILLRYLEKTKSSSDYGAISSGEQATANRPEASDRSGREPAVTNALEELYDEDAKGTGDYGVSFLERQVTVKGSEEPHGNGKEAVHNVLERTYLERTESPVDYDDISSETQVSAEEPVGPHGNASELVHHVLEEPYLKNAEISSETQVTLEGLQGPYRNRTEPVLEEHFLKYVVRSGDNSAVSLERQVTEEGPERSDSNASEPAYNVLEEPSLKTAESPANYGAIAPDRQVTAEGLVCNVLEKTYLENEGSPGNSSAISSEGRATAEEPVVSVNHGAEPVYNVLDKSYFEDAEKTENYGAISSREQATLEQPFNHGTEPFYNVLEETYPEEEDGSLHFDTICSEGPLCNRNVFRKIL